MHHLVIEKLNKKGRGRYKLNTYRDKSHSHGAAVSSGADSVNTE